jgi:hypothetical protein
MLKISKQVREGMLVAKRGDKYVRFGSHMRLAGVYTRGGARRTITNEGLVETTLPAGIIVYGQAVVPIAPPIVTLSRRMRAR